MALPVSMDRDGLKDKLRNPSETLQSELKSWLNLELPDHKAKVAKALLALRNRNGGLLIFGFDDKTLTPLENERPPDLRTVYHADKIQELVKNFALPTFPVEVHFVEREGVDFPVIVVPSGIKSPVICRQKYQNTSGAGEIILRQNAVYVRTVNNGRVESIEPRSAQDWDNLLEICFDNREADIGRFLRRHLGGVISELGLQQPVAASAPSAEMTRVGVSLPLTSVPSATRSPRIVLEEGATRFQERMEELKKIRPLGLEFKYDAWREVAVMVEGEVKPLFGQYLLQAVFPRHPNLSGWPQWIDSRQVGGEDSKPYPHDGGWQASVVMNNSAFAIHPLIDFWRIDPRGEFYHRRNLEDDLWPKIPTENRGTTFDIINGIKRVAEALATTQAFAQGMLERIDDGELRVSFRWSGLSGRRLVSVERGRDFWAPTAAHDNVIVSSVEVPVTTAAEALSSYVSKAVLPLFAAFGYQVSPGVVEELTNKTLKYPSS
ncbi:MAG: ATP-binding protein [Verrucomicrobia bacterium]|nr:ATP-binding protein [Verrucomicrobiota bacterium]